MMVYIVDAPYNDYHPVVSMFNNEGWEVTGVLDESNLVVFCGGSDVSPHLYGEKNTSSYCDPARDEYETSRYLYAKSLEIPMVGICRGGQFLNVMNGGKMIQHISGHSGYREINVSDRLVMIHEDHHQGIVAADNAYLLGTDALDGNEEIVFYAETNCLCFQPHPEWGHEGTKKLFFQLIEEYL